MKFKNLILVFLIINSFNVYSQLSFAKCDLGFEKPFKESSWLIIRDDLYNTPQKLDHWLN